MMDIISDTDAIFSTMNLDMNQLRAFVAVAVLGSFSKASQRLCRVQSAVSQQIQKLERHLDTELFVRRRRGLALTLRGEHLLAYALKILEMNDDAVAALTEKSPSGQIRVGTSDTYASLFLSEILHVCSERFPGILIDVQCGYSPVLWQRYDAGELDVVLTQGCPAHIPSELLHSELLAWVCASSSTISSQDPVPLALFTSGCSDRSLALSALHRTRKNYKIRYQSTSYAAVLAAVASGGYVSTQILSTITSGFRILGSQEGYPVLGSLDISLAYYDTSPTTPVRHFADIARDYFRSRNTRASANEHASAVVI